MVDELMSAYGDNFLVAALGVALGLLCLVIVFWLLRNRAPSPFVRGGRNRQPRLQVLDAAAVDTRRRIVLIRRDTVEHLVMIGGPTDIVIETGIGKEQAQAASAPVPLTEGARPAPALEAPDMPSVSSPPTPQQPAAARNARTPMTTAPRASEPDGAMAPDIDLAPEPPPRPKPAASKAPPPASASVAGGAVPRQAPAMPPPSQPEAFAPPPRAATVRTSDPEPATAATASAPMVTAERRTANPAPVASPSARSEPALFAAATFASTVSNIGLTGRQDVKSEDPVEASIDITKHGGDVVSPAIDIRVEHQPHERKAEEDKAQRRIEPTAPVSSFMPSIDDDRFGAARQEDRQADTAIFASASDKHALAGQPTLIDPAALVVSPVEITATPPLSAAQPSREGEPTAELNDEALSSASPASPPAVVGSVTELPHELTEIDDIYVPEDAPVELVDDRNAATQDTVEAGEPRQELDIPNVEHVLDAARHKVLATDDRPQPRPFPLERFNRTPEPMQVEPAEPPKRDMSDFERVLEQEMAAHLAAAPLPARGGRATDDLPKGVGADALSERPRLPPDVVLGGEGFAARLSANRPDDAKTETDPNLQSEIARIFGEMSASRNS